MRENRFPPGWDERRVRAVLEHYEGQSEEEAVAEAAFEGSSGTLMGDSPRSGPRGNGTKVRQPSRRQGLVDAPS